MVHQNIFYREILIDDSYANRQMYLTYFMHARLQPHIGIIIILL